MHNHIICKYLSEKIIYLLENPKFHLVLGFQAKKYSTRKVSWEKFSVEYFRFYKSFNHEN